MEIILKEDIKGLGYKNDVVKVKPGYGRNYLIPQGMAVLATESAKKILAENLKQAAHKAEKLKQDALNLAAQLEALVVEIAAKVSETGKIFGSVTNTQLADAIKNQHNLEIDRRRITIKQDEVKTLGEYTALIDLHREVKVNVKFKVVAD
jgi:large subunit ribosomal protein L9